MQIRATLLAAAIVLASLAATHANAQIGGGEDVLVVGSKVKEVIREAGLRSDGELVQAVSDKVHELLGAAISRAAQNGRQRLFPRDIDGESCGRRGKEIVVVGSKVKDVVRSAGFRAGADLVTAVSDKVHELLGTAIHRCTSNGRSTVRPYDL